MSSMMNRREFEKFNEQYNNKYASVILLARKARELSEEANFSIPESKALTWAVTGIKPTYIDKDEYANLRKLHTTEDILNYVSDERIVESVKESISKSKEEREITYIYDESLSEEDKQRVTILTNMIWYHAKV